MDFLWQTLFEILGYNISIIDIIDIILVLYLIFRIYKLAKGTAAINIFFGLAAIYLTYVIVDILRMKFLSQILGGFISIGFLMLVVLFQQEIRKYLSVIGKGQIIKNNAIIKFLNENKKRKFNYNAIIKSCTSFSRKKTGSIIIIEKSDNLEYLTKNAVKLNSDISFPLIESIFYKNSPLHDGAIIIRENKIIAARCILPITNNDNFPGELGMRHRAAVGISEETDAIAIIVSEQDGTISYAYEGKIHRDIKILELENILKNESRIN